MRKVNNEKKNVVKEKKENFSFSALTKTYSFKITGTSPLIINSSIEGWEENVKQWRERNKDFYNQQLEKSGFYLDDRYPGWTWLQCFYRPKENTEYIVVPSRLLTGCFNSGIRYFSKKNKFYKSLIRRFDFDELAYPLLVNGEKVKLSSITNFNAESYEEQKKIASNYDIELYETQVNITGKPALRVRPRIRKWSLEGKFSVRLLLRSDRSWEEVTELLTEIFNWAGENAGIGDWRPSSPRKRGEHGKFTIVIK